MSGRFDPLFVSFGCHYLYLRKFWSTPKTPFMTDKNNYDILFSDVKMPETVFHRIGGCYYDGQRNLGQAFAGKNMQKIVVPDCVALLRS